MRPSRPRPVRFLPEGGSEEQPASPQRLEVEVRGRGGGGGQWELQPLGGVSSGPALLAPLHPVRGSPPPGLGALCVQSLWGGFSVSGRPAPFHGRSFLRRCFFCSLVLVKTKSQR